MTPFFMPVDKAEEPLSLQTAAKLFGDNLFFSIQIAKKGQTLGSGFYGGRHNLFNSDGNQRHKRFRHFSKKRDSLCLDLSFREVALLSKYFTAEVGKRWRKKNPNFGNHEVLNGISPCFFVVQLANPLLVVLALAAAQEFGVNIVLLADRPWPLLSRQLKQACVPLDASIAVQAMLLMPNRVLEKGKLLCEEEVNFPLEEAIDFLVDKFVKTLLEKKSIERESSSVCETAKVQRLTDRQKLKKNGRLIFFTSGSTSEKGAGKAVVFNYYQMHKAISLQNKAFPFSPGCGWALALPIHHVAGLSILLRSMQGGGSVIYKTEVDSLRKNSFDGEAGIFEQCLLPHSIKITQKKVEDFLSDGATHISLVTTQLSRVSKKMLSCFDLVLIGGGPILGKHWKDIAEKKLYSGLAPAWLWSLPVFAPTYGMSETFAQVATWRPWLKEKAYALLPGREIAVLDNQLLIGKNSGSFEGYLHRGCLKAPFERGGQKNNLWPTSDRAQLRRYTFMENFRWFCFAVLSQTAKAIVFLIGLDRTTSSRFSFFKKIAKLPLWRGTLIEIGGRNEEWGVSGGENLHLPSIEETLYETGMLRFVCLTTVKDEVWGEKLQAILMPSREWVKKINHSSHKAQAVSVEDRSVEDRSKSNPQQKSDKIPIADGQSISGASDFLKHLKAMFAEQRESFEWPKDFFYLSDGNLKVLESEIGTLSKHKPPRRVLQLWLTKGMLPRFFE